MAAASDVVKYRFGVGDTDTTRRYALQEDGAAKNLTGYTSVKLYAYKRGGTAALSAITGTVISAAGGTVDFDHDTIAAAEGVYVCDIEFNSAAGIARCEETFLITVRARAASVTY